METSLSWIGILMIAVGSIYALAALITFDTMKAAELKEGAHYVPRTGINMLPSTIIVLRIDGDKVDWRGSDGKTRLGYHKAVLADAVEEL